MTIQILIHMSQLLKIDTIVTNLKNIEFFLQLFRNNIGYIKPENISKYKDEYKAFNKSLMTLISIIRSPNHTLFEITLSKSSYREEALEFLRKMHKILRKYVEKLEDNTNKLLDSYNYRSYKIKKKQINTENKIGKNKQQSTILYDNEEKIYFLYYIMTKYFH
jgi:hypothetical protein